MLVNYHTHTSRCHHATGTEREYIESAIKAGIKILGFSDHSPYWFLGDYYSGFRMRPEEAAGYIETISRLRDEYKKEIKIYIGYEAEYYEGGFYKTLEILNQYGYDYLLLGQHAVGRESDNLYTVHETFDTEILEEYVKSVVAGIETGKFFYVAHPDIMHFSGDDEKYRKEMRKICEAANKCGMPLEINLLGLRDNRFYPRKLFWEIASECKNKVIIGCDAHSPDTLCMPDNYNAGLAIAEKFNLELVAPETPYRQ